jgi:hypothetical protein
MGFSQGGSSLLEKSWSRKTKDRFDLMKVYDDLDKVNH